MKEHLYHIYIVANATRVLYTGICGPLRISIWQHKTKKYKGFTSRWNVCRLVYYESFGNVCKAIAREKQLKRWRRQKKVWLIESINRDWRDLSDGWYDGVDPGW
jgi:putative endonuclease